jgi:hypothetical protein
LTAVVCGARYEHLAGAEVTPKNDSRVSVITNRHDFEIIGLPQRSLFLELTLCFGLAHSQSLRQFPDADTFLISINIDPKINSTRSDAALKILNLRGMVPSNGIGSFALKDFERSPIYATYQ